MPTKMEDFQSLSINNIVPKSKKPWLTKNQRVPQIYRLNP